jgi:hypothetical protein
MIVEAMRQALEAMELEMKGYAAKHDRLMPAAHALRTAIAEAEKQEPVAWMWKDGTMTFDADRADGTWTPSTPPHPQHSASGLGSQMKRSTNTTTSIETSFTTSRLF